MKVALLLLPVVLTGCLTTPVAPPQIPKFPPASPALMEKCPNLKVIDKDKTVLSELTKTITENYTTYHECKIKVEEWIKWYNEQKNNFDKLSK